MSRSVTVRLLLVGFVITSLFTGCTRDPNVRKQKFLESGNQYRDKGKLREASIQYLNAIQIDSRFAEAHFELGEVCLKLKDYNCAAQQLFRTVELTPENYSAQLDLAELLIGGSRNSDGSPGQNYQDLLKQAKLHLDILREKQPNSPDTHVAWANFYAAQDDLKSAMQEMQKAIAADPNRPESYLRLAELQNGANRPDEAEENFKRAVQLGPNNMRAQLSLGRFYQKRHLLPQAEQQFKHAIDVDPKDPAPRGEYAGLLAEEGKKAEAEAFLKQTRLDLPDNSEAYSMLAVFYVRSGDFDKALAEYSSLYREHPRDVQVKGNYIEMLIRKSRLDEAAKLDDELLKANPKDPYALIYRGQVQLGRGDAAGAVDSLQRAVKNDSDNALAHYHLGRAFAMQRSYAEAESEFREAVNLHPDLIDAQGALAELEMRRRDVDALAQTAQQIVSGAPNSPDGYLFSALAEMARQKYSEAEQDLQKAIDLAPGNPVPYVQMGNLHVARKQYAEAAKLYQQALDRDAASTDGLQGLMKAYLVQRQPDQAIAAARTQIGKSPNNSGFYDLLGTALFENKKDVSGADAAFQKAIELDSSNSDALMKLAQVQRSEGSGSVSQALAIDLQSIKNHPHEISFYILAGMLYEDNNWEQAKAMYQQALNIQPDNPLASNNLAYGMLKHGGNVDVALAMAQTARRGMPDSPDFADTLGYAYYQKGVYQSAIDMFQESLRLNEKRGTDDPDVHYHLGLAYQKANQPAQARQQLERALKISHNFSDADDARRALSELRG
jgi:tetratricopeptide (TPR) repeat protein